jgi:hypothetical protein
MSRSLLRTAAFTFAAGALIVSMAAQGGSAAATLTWNWANPTPSGDVLTDIAVGHGVAVAVGGEGHIYSNIGGGWNLRDSGTSNILRCVTFGNGLFVAAGDHNNIVTSSDGVHWTLQRVADGNALYAAAYGNGNYVLAGTDGVEFHSSDGSHWTEKRNIAGISQPLVRAIFDGGLFVVTTGSSSILTSSDGVTWTLGNSGDGAAPDFVTFLGGTYAALDNNPSGNGASLITSFDAITWAGVSTPFPSNDVPISLTTDGSQFLALVWDNAAGAMLVFTSPDASTWTSHSTNLPTGFSQANMLSLVFDGTRYITVGVDSDIATSTDLRHWTDAEAVTATARQRLRGVHWINDQFMAVGDTDTLMTSADGISWDARTLTPAQSSNLRDITFGDGLYVVVGSAGTVLASSDGVHWTSHVIAAPAVSFEAVTFADALFVTVSAEGSIYTSPDGSTWTSRNSGTTDGLWAIAWTGAKFVVAADSVNSDSIRLLESADGKTWAATPFNVGTGTSLYGLRWTGSQLVAVGDAACGTNGCAILATSADGSNWTVHTGNVDDRFEDVVQQGSGYVVVANSGFIYSSSNGTIWTNSLPGLGVDGLQRLESHDARLVTTGYGGVILEATDAAPVAEAGSLKASAGSAADGTLTATDAAGLPLSYSVVSQPGHGTISVTDASTGAYTYTPTAGYSGSDSFSFKANDGTQDSNDATVSITVSSSGQSSSGGTGGGSSGGGDLGILSLAMLGLGLLGRRRSK